MLLTGVDSSDNRIEVEGFDSTAGSKSLNIFFVCFDMPGEKLRL